MSLQPSAFDIHLGNGKDGLLLHSWKKGNHQLIKLLKVLIISVFSCMIVQSKTMAVSIAGNAIVHLLIRLLQQPSSNSHGYNHHTH